MRSPHHLYVTFLCIEHGLDTTEVQRTLLSLEKAVPSQEFLDGVVKHIIDRPLTKPLKEFLMRKTRRIGDKESLLTLLEHLTIDDIWLNHHGTVRKQDLTAAEEVFKDREIAPEVNVLIMKNTTSEDIVRYLASKYDIHWNSHSVEWYKQYFFNKSFMSRADWLEYIPQTPLRERRFLMLGLKKDASFVRNKMGIDLGLEYSDMLRSVMNVSYMKFGTLAKNPFTHKDAQNWAKTMMDAGDRKTKLVPPSGNEFLNDIQMSFEYEDQEIPSIDDL